MDNIVKRWRLILGADSNEALSSLMQGQGMPILGDGNGINPSPLEMSIEDQMIDDVLAEIYGSSFDEIGSGKKGGNGKSMPNAAKWLVDVQNFFDKDIAKIIQNDAIERAGLKDLLLEPSILDQMEPNINLASTLMQLKKTIPDKSKDSVRAYIKRIVDDINKRLASEVTRAVTSKLNKREHSVIGSASAIDFKYTIRKNIQNYNMDLKTIIPQRVYFFDRANKNSNKYNIILDVDQSGSMGESVIYSSVLGCILASIRSLKTHVVAFDTEVVDLTDKSSDPVDLVYGFNLGGGTDINKSLAYCETLIENPSKTILFMVTDLYEFGNPSAMVQRLKHLKESGVNVICILAISDSGTPCYDTSMASKLANINIPCFACSPDNLPDLVDCALNNKTFINAKKH